MFDYLHFARTTRRLSGGRIAG